VNHRQKTPTKSRVRPVRRCGCTLLLVLGLAVAAPPAGALTINASFVAAGSSFPNGNTATAAPTTTAGGGSLQGVFATAASYWEKAILSPGTVTIDFGWAGLTGNVLATTFTGGGTTSFIEFNSAGTSPLFLDATPAANSEYTTFTPSSANLGGGTVNTGRVFTGATGAASGRYDLLSVALHEIGHALGFTPSSGAPVVVTNPLPNAGTSIPTTTTGHIDITTAELYPSLPPSERKLLTGVDILGVAQLAGYKSVDLNPVPVPLPGALILMASGLAAFGTRLRLRRAA